MEPRRLPVAVSCWHDAQDTVLRSVSLVGAATGAITWTRPVHSGANGLAFSPDGGHLAIAGYAVDHIQVRILDAGSGEPVWTRDDDAPRGLCYSPDGGRLAMGYIEGLMVVDARTGDVTFLLERPMDYPFVAAFSPGGRWFAADSNYGLYAVDMVTGQIAWQYPQLARAIAFSDDESRLTAVTGDHQVVTFDCEKGVPLTSPSRTHWTARRIPRSRWPSSARTATGSQGSRAVP